MKMPLARPARAATGRSDLFRAFVSGGEEALAAMARILGYQEKPRAPERTEERAVPSSREGVARADGPQFVPVPFWRLTRVEHLAPFPPPPGRTIRPIDLGGVGIVEGKRLRVPALAAEAQLSAALRRRLASAVPSRRVDVRRLAAQWSRGEPVRAIPFRPLAAWAPRITVLVDRSSHLIPFWHDQDRLLELLRGRLGDGAVHEARFLGGMNLPWRTARGRDREPWVDPSEPVLALSDLGFLLDETRREFWAGLAERARRAGTEPSALVPCPGERWQGRVARLWDALEWERPGRAAVGGRRFSDEDRLDRAERLLALLSFAARVEPGLLRRVRRLLPAQAADAGTEADLWTHPEVVGGYSRALGLRPELRERLQARFAAETPKLRSSVVQVMRAWRAGEPKEVWLDEVAALDAAANLAPGVLRAEEISEAEQLWQRIGETLENPASAVPRVTRALERFVGRAVRERLTVEAWDSERWQPLFARAWSKAWKGAGAPPLPPGVGSGVLDLPRGEPFGWQAWQVENELSWAPIGSPLRSGSPLAVLESADGFAALGEEGVRWVTPRPLGESVTLPESSTLLLLTDRTRATLRRINRPEWASALGRDRFGLWATLEIEEVEQRMRWISPGRFWMGSPEDEPGRFDDEGPRHLEDIKDGFWLGETPCTQALWQAVMGENPSRFQSPDRPVEQVSWEDCQEFFEKLGKEDPDGERWRLPGEAEWEYACRAGTETATYAGPIEILGANNAPALHPIAWYGGNSGEEFDLENGEDSSGWPEKQIEHSRAGTHPVGRKSPNPWGLSDTLGNVFEWCEEAVDIDLTPNRRGSIRVIRGGSWGSLARDCRAAYRFMFVPSFRGFYLGFRLARGQTALKSGAEPGGAERPDRGVARRGTRPPASGPLTP